MRKLIWLFALLTTACAVTAQTDMDDSKAFVRSLSPECAYTDGYTCAEISEDNFLTIESENRLVPGPYLAAWSAAYQAFLGADDMDDEIKDLHHYRIGFTEDENYYIVLFRALLMPHMSDGNPQGVSRVTFGQTTKYWVDKKTLEVADRKWLR